MNTHAQPNYLYLHGFASGPSSTKARFFASKLADRQIRALIPNLNGLSFERLTLTGQLEIIRRSVGELGHTTPLVVIGSSMGGLLATLTANECPCVVGLVLLAPGFGLPRRWRTLLGEDGLNDWENQGYTEVFHYELNQTARLSYDFIVDAETYQTDRLETNVPTLVFHGKNDETVPVEESIAFAELNPEHVQLHVLDADHQLIEPLEHMWSTTDKFLTERSFLPLEG